MKNKNNTGNILHSTSEEIWQITKAIYELHRINYLNPYKAIVTGSRDFDNYELLRERLDEQFWQSDEFQKWPIKIISGMEKEAKTLVIRYADKHKLTDFFRNEDMLRTAAHLAVL